MAHFYGTLNGKNRKQSTQQGTRESGMVTHCASWAGCVKCTTYIRHIGDEEVDCVLVEKDLWEGHGEKLVLYDGPIGEFRGKGYEEFGKRSRKEKTKASQSKMAV